MKAPHFRAMLHAVTLMTWLCLLGSCLFAGVPLALHQHSVPSDSLALAVRMSSLEERLGLNGAIVRAWLKARNPGLPDTQAFNEALEALEDPAFMEMFRAILRLPWVSLQAWAAKWALHATSAFLYLAQAMWHYALMGAAWFWAPSCLAGCLAWALRKHS